MILGAVRDSVENLRNEISQGIKKGISEHEAKEMIQKFLYEIEQVQRNRSEPSFGTRTEKGDPTSL